MPEQLTKEEQFGISGKAVELRDGFKRWLQDGKYSPLSDLEESAVDVFATWLLMDHKVKHRD